MYKVAWIARFRPGMSKDDGRRHWRETPRPARTRGAGQSTATSRTTRASRSAWSV